MRGRWVVGVWGDSGKGRWVVRFWGEQGEGKVGGWGLGEQGEWMVVAVLVLRYSSGGPRPRPACVRLLEALG